MSKERLDQLLEHFISVGVPGCALVVSYKGKIVYTGYRGLARTEDKKAIDENTIYQIYSNTKNITAVAVMKLFEKGLILLNDPIEKYLPCFANATYQTWDGSNEIREQPVSRSIRIKDLLAMTSGLPQGGKGSMTSYEYGDMMDMFQCPIMELAERLSKIPLEFDLGTHWHYGVSFDILGALVEAVSGKKFSRFLKEEIFEPLQMTHTTFLLTKEMEPDFANIYILENGKQVNAHILPFMTEENGCQGESGGGGLLSTLEDMIHFTTMLAMGGTWNGQKILSRNTIDLMRENHLEGQAFDDFQAVARKSWPWFEGYSWGLGGRTLISRAQSGSSGPVGEYGWCGAAGSYLMADPERELGIMYMHQMFPVVGNLQDYCHPRIRNVVYSLLDEWEK